MRIFNWALKKLINAGAMQWTMGIRILYSTRVWFMTYLIYKLIFILINSV